MTTDNSRVGPTPGPWVVSGLPHKTMVRAGSDRTGRRIASTWVQDSASAKGAAINEANARLIAAAPDLLEALQHAVSVIEAHVPRDALGMEGSPQDGMWPLLDEYLHHMKAAISKARGQS